MTVLGCGWDGEVEGGVRMDGRERCGRKAGVVGCGFVVGSRSPEAQESTMAMKNERNLDETCSPSSSTFCLCLLCPLVPAGQAAGPGKRKGT